MADRYWVGGTANWDATAGTKWATTSGGTGGASVPTSADNVFFTNLSTGTCSISASANCLSFNSTGFTGTISGSGALTIYGSLTIMEQTVWFHSGNITFGATLSNGYTISAPNKILGGNVTFSGSPTTTWTLQTSLRVSAQLSISAGTFTTNNYDVSATNFQASGTSTRAVNFGSSTVTVTGSSMVFAPTGLTFNAGTSSIILSGSTTALVISVGSSFTFYNVSFTAASTNAIALAGSNTFNNLTIAAPSTAGVRPVTFAAPQIINGTLSTTGTAGNRRIWFYGVTYGLAQTLTINSAPSLTDADFRDIYVIGTAAPISGTRIGDLRGIRGITASTPKTVYWNLAAGGNWSANAWAATSGGAVSTDNFPLAQDTAVIGNTGLNTSATVTLDSAITYVGTVDMSARTNAMTIGGATAYTIYGNLTAGSGTTYSGVVFSTFSGRNTQTITSAGKAYTSNITIDSYGGIVQLADALNIGANTVTVTNGTFDTKNYNVTAGSLSSSNTNVRAINLGSSTVTLSTGPNLWLTGAPTNLTFNAGTSTILLTNTSAGTFAGGGLTFYNVTFAGTTAVTHSMSGVNTFNNLTFTAPASAGLMIFSVAANQTINGTLTVAGATAVRRIFVRSDVLGTQRDLTVGTLIANDCDFRDIEILGAAIGTAPTRAGDCGGNNNITFPSPKTVYWNLAGTNTWFGNGWCSTSGGTPDVNSFPLVQDTAIFDDAGAVTAVNPNVICNIGNINMSARTAAISAQFGGCTIYGSVILSSALTTTALSTPTTYSGRGTQTITSAGVTFNNPITIDSFSGTVQLADALTLSSTRTLTLTSGTFDAVTYNVTTGVFSFGSGTAQALKMGSGTWTLSGTGTVWALNSATNLSFYKGTADILLSNTSTTTRTFTGGGASYNKLTIGGTTGTSTTNIEGTGNQFTELSSTKTVAHTIALGTTAQTFGAWTVTGTAGNVVTVTGTATLTIAGARVSGVDYLAMGTTAVSATSPGEFYAGANSTGSNATIIKTAAPAPVTRYWVGGTGTWNATTTTNWSATSGGAGGASVPTSADAVVFDMLSNATAYTVTCTATQLRCGSLTMSGPLTGNVTWAGTAPLAIHDNVTLPATGLTRTYSGDTVLSGSTTGKTFTTNGVSLVSQIDVNGVNCGWSLGNATNTSNTLVVTNGSFDTASYSFSVGTIRSDFAHTRSLSLGSSVLTLGTSGSFPIDFGTTETNRNTLTFSAGTSQINDPRTSPTFNGNNKTFYNYAFTSTGAGTVTLNGANTFSNLSFTGITTAGLKVISLQGDQTINGTLTLSAGTNATMRHFVRSDAIGTTRTLTCAAFSGTDADFRDITIAGAAAPVSGTRLGDCKGNSGITFDAAKTVYWNVSGGNWGSAAWSATSNGTTDVTQFPLAQDTAVFIASSTKPSSGSPVTINAAYNIGTIDMSARTLTGPALPMTLATGTTAPAIYGNWVNGTGTTLTGTGTMTFAGRGSQTITSAGKTFTQGFTVNSPGGSVTLQDAFVCSSSVGLTHTSGTLDASTYNVTFTGTGSGPFVTSSNTNVRTLAFGSGTWVIAGSSTAFTAATSTNLTVTGTGTISLTSASAKIFAGGGVSYSGITLDQGGAGTLTITGNNTFANISNTYKATGATNITLGTTTQTVGNFTASGEAGRVLTVQGSSASSPATLVLTGGTVTTPDYLAVTGVRAYSLVDTWYAGANSINNGSLGWYFSTGLAPTSSIYYGATNVTVIYYGSIPVSAIYYGSTQVF